MTDIEVGERLNERGTVADTNNADLEHAESG